MNGKKIEEIQEKEREKDGIRRKWKKKRIEKELRVGEYIRIEEGKIGKKEMERMIGWLGCKKKEKKID